MNSASDLSITWPHTWPRPAQGQTVFLVKKLFFFMESFFYVSSQYKFIFRPTWLCPWPHRNLCK